MAYGTACDDARECDPSFAMLMLGCTCYEVLSDESDGRSIDPTQVTAPPEWRIGKNLPAIDADLFHRFEQHDRAAKEEDAAWVNAFAPCEALASRDPGAS